jgi:hypothetical protein
VHRDSCMCRGRGKEATGKVAVPYLVNEAEEVHT